MAKKAKSVSSSRKTTTPAKTVAARSTPVRNTPIPKSPSAAKAAAKAVDRPITHEMIAQRAYFISISGSGLSQADNWLRAERELRSGL